MNLKEWWIRNRVCVPEAPGSRLQRGGTQRAMDRVCRGNQHGVPSPAHGPPWLRQRVVAQADCDSAVPLRPQFPFHTPASAAPRMGWRPTLQGLSPGAPPLCPTGSQLSGFLKSRLSSVDSIFLNNSHPHLFFTGGSPITAFASGNAREQDHTPQTSLYLGICCLEAWTDTSREEEFVRRTWGRP